MSKIPEQLQGLTTPLMVFLLIVGAFFIGRLSSQVETLKSEKVAGAQVAQQGGVGDTQAPTISMDTIKGLFKKDVIKFGDANKKVLFVEVSDPSCPFCHAAAGKNAVLSKQMGTQFVLKADGGSYIAPVIEMKKLVDEGKAGMVWIYSNGHGNGELAAKALFCANEKGKYWQAHDLLFSDAGYTLINEKVKNDVAKSGEMASFLKSAVDEGFMKNCLSSDKYKDRLAEDIKLAQSLGVQGTPGFFVNTTNYPGAISYDDMQSAVDAALK